MSQRQELMESFMQVYKEGGRQDLVESISEANEQSDNDPIIVAMSIVVPTEEMAMMRVVSTDHLIGYANQFLKSVGDNAYIHIKEIASQHDRIKLLESFHSKSIDEIIEDNRHLQEGI